MSPVSGSAGAGWLDELDDATLAGLIGAADPGALAVLYQRHRTACYRLAQRVTANDVLAEDAVQEAFTGLWDNPAAYLHQRGSVRGWLLTLTRHKAVDAVRRETAQQRLRKAHALQQAVNPPACADPVAGAWRAIQASRIGAALAALPKPQRQALLLAYSGGYTQREIAELTGVPLGTVKSRISAAARRLQAGLSDLGREIPL
ncbi:MAG TPA: sigma-70 family RNA polymerase sigma factor [Streptosporangiaceae bacterium]|jgi:RNA polymerase sigma factor (sigma-70 family)|nr:sigma-70 family RNA polymerase sigma factor [Streptosporangiaceae bacterium]